VLIPNVIGVVVAAAQLALYAKFAGTPESAAAAVAAAAAAPAAAGGGAAGQEDEERVPLTAETELVAVRSPPAEV